MSTRVIPDAEGCFSVSGGQLGWKQLENAIPSIVSPLGGDRPVVDDSDA